MNECYCTAENVERVPVRVPSSLDACEYMRLCIHPWESSTNVG